jgi:hypothetical protein
MKNENIRTAEQRSNTKKSNISVVDWDGYRDYLSNLNKSKKEIQNKIGYGRTYCYVLETGNAQGLMKWKFPFRITIQITNYLYCIISNAVFNLDISSLSKKISPSSLANFNNLSHAWI